MEYSVFNIYEGSFWLILGMSCFILIRFVPSKFKKLSLIAGVTFAVFGITDYCEVYFGELFEPRLWWLVGLKGLCIAGIIFVIGRYIYLRK
jgi:hypothetical protein